MRLLLDTNIVIALVDARLDALGPARCDILAAADSALYVSVASLWEIAIKTRLGKLALNVAPTLLPGLIERIGIALLAIDQHHVLAAVDPEPATRDPFDRLLLAQCQIESLRLMTLDRALSNHPLSWQAA